MNSNLTGRRRHRTNFFGQLILQVEESYINHDCESLSNGKTFTRWRDAKAQDISNHRADPTSGSGLST